MKEESFISDCTIVTESNKTSSSACPREGCICQRFMDSVNISKIRNKEVLRYENNEGKFSECTKRLIKIGDVHYFAELTTESWTNRESENLKEWGQASSTSKEKLMNDPKSFRFPSAESLSGESTTTTESDAYSSSSLSSLSSSDDDSFVCGANLLATESQERTLRPRSNSGGKMNLLSSSRSFGKNEIALPALSLSTVQPQRCHLSEETLENSRSVYATSYKQIQKRALDLASKFRQFMLKKSSLKDSLHKGDSSFERYVYKKNELYNYFHLGEFDFRGEIVQHMRKSLKTKTKRNQTYLKRRSNLEIASDSSSENLDSEHRSMLKYTKETGKTSFRRDHFGINLHIGKYMNGSIKSRLFGGPKMRQNFENNPECGDVSLESHGSFPKSNVKLQLLQSLAGNTNNNSKDEGSQERRASSLRRQGTISVSLGEEVQRGRQNELRHRLIYLIKEQDKMLREIGDIEEIEGRVVRRRETAVVDKARWKLELKAVEGDYHTKVEGIINNLKASVQNERWLPSFASEIGTQGQMSHTGANNNADSKPTEDGQSSPGFFRSLLKRRVKPLGEKEKVRSRFSFKGLFTRRSREIKDDGSYRLMNGELGEEEEMHPGSFLEKGSTSDRKEDVTVNVEKLKKILKKMMKDVSETSDVDLLVEEAMILAGLSAGERDSVYEAQIEKIENKFRCNFEKKMRKLRLGKEKIVGSVKIEAKVE